MSNGCQMVVKWGALRARRRSCASRLWISNGVAPAPFHSWIASSSALPHGGERSGGELRWITELHTRATPRARTAKRHRGRRRTIVSLRVRCQKNKRPSGGYDGIDLQPPAPPSSMLTANVLSALNKNGRLFFWSKQPHIAKGRQH